MHKTMAADGMETQGHKASVAMMPISAIIFHFQVLNTGLILFLAALYTFPFVKF